MWIWKCVYMCSGYHSSTGQIICQIKATTFHRHHFKCKTLELNLVDMRLTHWTNEFCVSINSRFLFHIILICTMRHIISIFFFSNLVFVDSALRLSELCLLTIFCCYCCCFCQFTISHEVFFPVYIEMFVLIHIFMN